MRNNGVLSRISRPARRVIVGAGATVIAATALLGMTAVAANADTLPNGKFVNLYSTPVPATPPAYVSSTNAATADGVLPYGNGQMGNPVELTLPNAGQVLGLQGGSTAAANTPVISENPISGSADDVWRFQRVGWVDAWDNSELIGEPVYKVVNYYPEAGTHSCLTVSDATNASGSSIYPGNEILSYGCDVGQFNQTNQLWIVTGSVQDPADCHLLANPSTGALISENHCADSSYLSATSSVGSYSLIPLASAVANGIPLGDYELYDALALSSLGTSLDNASGQNAASVLYNPDNTPANTDNALYGFKQTGS